MDSNTFSTRPANERISLRSAVAHRLASIAERNLLNATQILLGQARQIVLPLVIEGAK